MGYDSVGLLAKFNRKAGRPATDMITDASKYERLTEAQNSVIAQLSGIMPSALYPISLLALTPASDRKTFSFGTDSLGQPITPMGKTGIFPSLGDYPDGGWIEGRDYLNEGTRIRIPNDLSYSGTLYWHGISPAPDITAASPPVLFPVSARDLIVIEAVRIFASEYARNPGLVSSMLGEWAQAWPRWCLVWKTQFQQGGGLLSYTGGDLAIMGQV